MIAIEDIIMIRKWTVAALLTLIALPALADPPDDVVDLLGARAPGAESEMQARGYADAGGNNMWWNAKTGVCAKVHVSQGRYQTIDMVTPADCGMKALEESDAKGAAEPSQAAMDACMNSADQYQNEESGTSTVKRFKRSGENWVVTLDTLGRTTHCTVTQAGAVIAMDPP